MRGCALRTNPGGRCDEGGRERAAPSTRMRTTRTTDRTPTAAGRGARDICVDCTSAADGRVTRARVNLATFRNLGARRTSPRRTKAKAAPRPHPSLSRSLLLSGDDAHHRLTQAPTAHNGKQRTPHRKRTGKRPRAPDLRRQGAHPAIARIARPPVQPTLTPHTLEPGRARPDAQGRRHQCAAPCPAPRSSRPADRSSHLARSPFDPQWTSSTSNRLASQRLQAHAPSWCARTRHTGNTPSLTSRSRRFAGPPAHPVRHPQGRRCRAHERPQDDQGDHGGRLDPCRCPFLGADLAAKLTGPRLAPHR